MRVSTLLTLAVLWGCNGKNDDTGSTQPVDDQDGDGYTIDEGDCDDTDAQVNPAQAEVYYTGIDEDCDPTTVDTDQDGDGVSVGDDCVDTDATIFPGAEELCDGIDNDCSGVADDGAVGSETGWTDADIDGYGDPASPVDYCGDLPAGVVDNDDDCDDGDAAFNPGATEECGGTIDYNCDGSVGDADNDGDGWAACLECNDGDALVNPDAAEVCNDKDDNCDGVIDTDAVDQATWYLDEDGDLYGQDAATMIACDQPEGYADVGGDCDDGDVAFNPGAPEECTDTIDYNCDGSVGYEDLDGDGVAACDDCDDSNAEVYPGAVEVCDLVDNDCSGAIDDGAVDASTWYLDDDGDGHGVPDTTTTACDPPEGYAADPDDCDDGTVLVSPDATEICDTLDNDCDGQVDDDAVDATLVYADMDGDTYGDDATATLSCDGGVAIGGDCNDADATTNPAASEVCDGLDNDCDGVADDGAPGSAAWYMDGDGDGYGDATTEVFACGSPGANYVENGDDCDDTTSSVTAGSTWYTDGDGDGYGDGPGTVSCEPPAASATIDGDCDDGDATVNPGAAEVCDGADDDCDGEVDEAGADGESAWYRDSDGDGYGDATVSLVQCDAPTGYAADDSDCDDTDGDVHPGAVDDYDTVDTDCDGWVDEDALNVGDVIITEVVRQPRFGSSSTQSNGMWFELYNTSANDVDMSNWYVLRSNGATSTDAFFVDPTSAVVVPAGGYAVFCKTDNYVADADASVPLGCDYIWGDETQSSSYSGYYHDNTFNLQRDEDRLAMFVGGGSSTGTLIDDVTWFYDAHSGYWPRDASRAMVLDPDFYTESDNDDVANWCSAPTSGTYDTWWVDGSSREYGTPGALNYDCY